MVDNFRDTIATAGVDAGDAILKEVAHILTEHRGDKDVVSRFGDHTFTFLARQCGDAGARNLAENICRAVEDHMFDAAGTFVSPTCSIGVALTQLPVESAQEFINQAYLASESAANSGGNLVHTFDLADLPTSSQTDTGITVAVSQNLLDDPLLELLSQHGARQQGDRR